MHPPSIQGLILILAAGFACASALPAAPSAPVEHVADVAPRAALDCLTDDTSLQRCFTGTGQTPYQNLNVTDIAYIGNQLRTEARTNSQKNVVSFVTMAASNITNECIVSTLITHGNVRVVLQHLDPTISSNVLLKDIATTIDGIEADETSKLQPQAGIIGCGASGGSLGVIVDLANSYYRSDDYLAQGYTPYGILIKVMSTFS